MEGYCDCDGPWLGKAEGTALGDNEGDGDPDGLVDTVGGALPV